MDVFHYWIVLADMSSKLMYDLVVAFLFGTLNVNQCVEIVNQSVEIVNRNLEIVNRCMCPQSPLSPWRCPRITPGPHPTLFASCASFLADRLQSSPGGRTGHRSRWTAAWRWCHMAKSSSLRAWRLTRGCISAGPRVRPGSLQPLSVCSLRHLVSPS